MALGQLDFAAEFARLTAEGVSESTTNLGGVAIRFVKVAGGGEGRWDSHAATAETALCWSGDFSVEFREGTVRLAPGGCCVVPKNAEHRGKSIGGAEIVLFTTAEP